MSAHGKWEGLLVALWGHKGCKGKVGESHGFLYPHSCKKGTEIVMFFSVFSIFCRLCVRERAGKDFVVMAGEGDS